MIGLGEASEIDEATADLAETLIVVRHQLRVAEEQLERFCVASEIPQETAQFVKHCRIRGVELERALEQILFPRCVVGEVGGRRPAAAGTYCSVTLAAN